MLTTTVIIPVYQGAATISQALKSVLMQSSPVREIIVIDDGSTDNLKTVLEPYRKKIKLLTQKNAGAAAARNAGIKMATSDLIAFIDADDVWLPDKIKRQTPLFADPEVGVVFGNANFFYQNQKQTKTYFDLYSPSEGEVFFPLFVRDFIPFSSVIIRRKLLQTELFDSSIYCEDYDILLRIAQKCHFAYVTEPVLYYRVSNRQKSTNYLKVAESVLKIKEKLYEQNNFFFKKDSAALAVNALSKCYLRLAFCYLRQQDHHQARKVLLLAKKRVGRKLLLTLFIVFTYCPSFSRRWLIRIYDLFYKKSEYGFG